MSVDATWDALLDAACGRRARRSGAKPVLAQHLLSRAVAALAPAWSFLGAGLRDERGTTVPIFALAGAVLIGFAALAVDVGMWEGNVGTMQGAADQAALAAGAAMSAGSATAQKEAKGVAAAHGLVDGTRGTSVTVNTPPAKGSYTATANAIEVVISQPQKTFLSTLFLKSPPVASARAAAVPSPASTCILMLAPQRAIASNGPGGIDASTCNVYVNAADACDPFLNGTGGIKGFDVFLGEQSQAGCSLSSQVAAVDKLYFGAAPALDPYASRVMPKPSTPCQQVNTFAQKKIVLDPGTYCGLSLLGSQSVKLNPGLYIFDGGGISATGTGI